MVAVVHAVDADVVDSHNCDTGVHWRQFVANHVGVDYVRLIRLQRNETENVRTVGEMMMEEKKRSR